MFLGEFRQAIDESGGLVLPSQFLVAFASGMVVTRGFDRNLMLFAHDEWQLLAQKILNQPLSIHQSRNLRRRIFSNAAVLRFDKYSRIQIPDNLCEFAVLKDEVVFTGMYDYLEIWNSQLWQSVSDAFCKENDGSAWEDAGV
jgi:MraZ protein